MLPIEQKTQAYPANRGYYENSLVLHLIGVFQKSFPSLQARVLHALALWVIDCEGKARMSARYFGQRNGIPKSTAARVTLLAFRLGLGVEEAGSTDMNPCHRLTRFGIKLFNAARRAQSGTPAPTYRRPVEKRFQASTSTDSSPAPKLLTSWPKWDTVNKPKTFKTNYSDAPRAARSGAVVAGDRFEREAKAMGATAQQVQEARKRVNAAIAAGKRVWNMARYAVGVLRNVMATSGTAAGDDGGAVVRQREAWENLPALLDALAARGFDVRMAGDVARRLIAAGNPLRWRCMDPARNTVRVADFAACRLAAA